MRTRTLLSTLGAALMIAAAPSPLVGCSDIDAGQLRGRANGGSNDDATADGGAASGGPGSESDPGSVAMRRLTNTEYCNTVHDLLGTSLRPCDDFPADGVANGFDTNAELQTISPLHIEMYEQAAEKLVAELMALPATDARRTKIVSCTPDAAAPETCARQIFGAFASRAYRRPATDDEVARLVGLIATAKARGGTVTDGVALGLEATLLAPQFLFRPEVDPDAASTAPHALGDYELATRLSYSLWSTMPDDALFDAAGKGALHDRAGLLREVERMLKDPKAQALTKDFAGQWLRTRELPGHAVDPATYPGVDAPLRAAMKGEIELLFSAFVSEPRPARELLDADFTFVNDTLAKFYGLPAPGTATLTRTSLAGSDRRGVLTRAGLLTVTSPPNGTSAVKRGVYVLGAMLCSPPAPPPDATPLVPPTGDTTHLTMRDRLKAHRAQPQCAACHNAIDPIGLGFENFDGVGRFRTMDGDQPIDASGALPDGRAFKGPTELAAMLSTDPKFEECLTKHLTTYVLGHALDDRSGSSAWIRRITDAARSSGGSVGAIVTSIVTSEPFTMRRGEAPGKDGASQ
jgi:hypothetical protein